MRVAILALALFAAVPAAGQRAEPRFCPNRPSLGSSACITERGQVLVEWSALEWERDRDPATRTDTFLIGETLARFGIAPRTELQVAWTPLGIARMRDRGSGAVDRRSRSGDATIALRQNLANPDGSGLSFGVQPFVTLPVGREPIGAGDWSAGMLVPVTYDLSERLNIEFTGEVDAAADADGKGRHLAFSGILGLARELGEQVVVNGELGAEHDNDPGARATRAFATASVAWRPARTWQFDALAVAGLNHATPAVRLVVGGAFLLGRVAPR